MEVVIWIICAWIGGTALILGSLMLLGSLLLWFVPASSSSGNPAEQQPSPPLAQPWQNRLVLMAIALILTLLGLGLLLAFPFPSQLSSPAANTGAQLH